MIRRGLIPLLVVLAVLALLAGLSLSLGALTVGPSQVLSALRQPDPQDYAQIVVATQRLPRVLMAIHAGACLAAAGLVMQGLTRNPLAAPTTLGVNAGAMLAVLVSVFGFGLGMMAQGLAALAGGAVGFAASLGVARLAGIGRGAQRGLALILAGALVSMLLMGLAQALLLSDPTRRTDFLAWAAGNINHVYAARLAAFWWIGAAALLVLAALSRPLTLMLLGADKAASAGVNVQRTEALALAAAVMAAASAVAVCGPIGFVGLVVPHLVRPFTGAAYGRALPVAAVTGACACLAADIAARSLFAPSVIATGLMLDLIGGIAFAVIVRRHYLRPAGRAVAA
ncbi:FecCD family ABC transporter permease [Paracoccus sp. p4-l81]|uniref:FecCD family ABC transporter permease n=1 Tax=Paracoccus sp. p4-l81 TaxID=3342806 RepID=UPI0035B84B54